MYKHIRPKEWVILTGINGGLKPLVLVADDRETMINLHAIQLSMYGIEYVTATSLLGLGAMFDTYKDELDAIILDGCIPGNALNTLDFIKEARGRGFTQPIIAASSYEKYRAQMVEAGCSHEAPKELAADLVAELLGVA